MMREAAIGGKRQKFLFLLSDAPGFCEFFPVVGAALERRGHEVIYASDSSHVTYLAKLFHPGIKVFNLFDFDLPADRNPMRINRGALADWERALYYYGNSSGVERQFKLNITRSKFFPETLFAEQHYDVVFSESPAGIYTFSFFDFCKENGIPWIGFEGSRISGYWEFPDSDVVFPVNATELETFVESYLETILGVRITGPNYMNPKAMGSLLNTSIFSRLFRRVKIREYILAFRSTLAGSRDFFGARPIYKYLINLKMLFLKHLKRFRPSFALQSSVSFLPNNGTIFFPLHFHPEASTSMLSPEFLSESDLLFYISTHVAADVKILVKEHPSMAGLRRRSELRSLSHLPNVVLLSATANTTDLIDRCDLCLTLTSTAGFEALMRGKAVISLGEVFFNKHRNCRVARTKRDALDLIIDFINRNWDCDGRDMDAYNRVFLSSHLSKALRFDMNFYEVECFEGRASALAMELSRATIGANG